MKIYLSHPIAGLSVAKVLDYYEVLIEKLRPYYSVLSPMSGKDYLRAEDGSRPMGYHHPLSTDRAIIGRDYWMVHQADVVLVDLMGAERISIGCMMELAWAYHERKHTVLVMEAGNLHHHLFVFQAADVTYPSLDDAVDYVCRLSGRSL